MTLRQQCCHSITAIVSSSFWSVYVCVQMDFYIPKTNRRNMIQGCSYQCIPNHRGILESITQHRKWVNIFFEDSHVLKDNPLLFIVMQDCEIQIMIIKVYSSCGILPWIAHNLCPVFIFSVLKKARILKMLSHISNNGGTNCVNTSRVLIHSVKVHYHLLVCKHCVCG
jgi:hypothetical protein